MGTLFGYMDIKNNQLKHCIVMTNLYANQIMYMCHYNSSVLKSIVIGNIFRT